MSLNPLTINGQKQKFSSSLAQHIGNTPLLKLDGISKELGTNVYAKLEYFNPGLSAKDRIAAHMIQKAEKLGHLKPGGTVIEATSGNTGLGLAMICRVKGYRCVLTVADKASKEKINSLKSLGAEVVLCPAKVAPDDPRSYYQQAIRLAEEIEGSYYSNQNYNNDNCEAHYLSTGPEIWEQSDHKITHFVCTVGTGGTISGTSKFLKEVNPNIQVIGVDAFGSVLTNYFRTGEYDISIAYSYKMEGVGKTIIPDCVAFKLIDQFIQIDDLTAALRARKLASNEAVWGGHSAGGALEAVYKLKDKFGPDDHVVFLVSDHGSKYLSTIYNDDWLKENLETKV